MGFPRQAHWSGLQFSSARQDYSWREWKKKGNWTVQFNKCLGKILTDDLGQISRNKSLGWKLSAYWLVFSTKDPVWACHWPWGPPLYRGLDVGQPFGSLAKVESLTSEVVLEGTRFQDTALLRRHADSIKTFSRWLYYVPPCDLRQNIIITDKMNIRE